MSKIIGYGYAKPTQIITNVDLEKVMETNDEWISSRTGIKQRNIHTGSQVDIALEAAQNAIKDSGINKDEIDYVLVSSSAPDDTSNTTSAKVAELLGLNKPAVIDTNSACTGFISNMAIARALVESKMAKTILVIAAEMLSRTVDFNDRTSSILFGDGAGAVLVTESKKQQLMDIELHSLPSPKGTLDLPRKYEGNPFRDGFNLDRQVIEMNGHAVFNFAVKRVSESLLNLIEKNDINMDEVDMIVCHQANIRILQGIAKRSKLDYDKFVVNIERWANTSSATIPIALAELKEQGKLKPGMKLILTGFGGGLTFGSVYMEV